MRKTVIPCEKCRIIAKNGIAYWSCEGGYHPELITLVDLVFLSFIFSLPIVLIALDGRHMKHLLSS